MKDKIATLVLYSLLMTVFVSWATSKPYDPKQKKPYLLQPEDADRYETLISAGDEVYEELYGAD